MPSPKRPFAARVIAWQRRHGRHGLPWQGTREPYPIWVSEIMLQQTQVATVIPYFERLLARFPGIAALAEAPEEEVLRLWSGLGYYARARNLHRAARTMVARHGGRFPLALEEAIALPGIGRSTAAAILVFATGGRHAILDGNVKRVLARHFGIAGAVDSPATAAKLWALAESLVPGKGVESYTQGLMDLGAGVCTRSTPDCASCPLESTCVALRDGRIAELPGRKARRAVPERAIAMLVAISNGKVLLEKRPATGIWGGLWSLPEAPADADPAAWATKTLGLRVHRVEALEPFTHAFTHFTLAVTPWRLTPRGAVPAAHEGRAMWLALQEVGTAALPAAHEGRAMWLALQEVGTAALPAPVKKLLLRLPIPARGRGGGR